MIAVNNIKNSLIINVHTLLTANIRDVIRVRDTRIIENRINTLIYSSPKYNTYYDMLYAYFYSLYTVDIVFVN